MYSIIEKKRDKKELSYDDLKFFIDSYCQDKIFDDQAAALLMAIFLNVRNIILPMQLLFC